MALIDSAEEALSSSRLLGSSLGSLSSPRKGTSEVSKVYKEVSKLFLTRRLPEALATIEPLITVPRPAEETTEDEVAPEGAPIAGASRNSRIKVWLLYLTLLNAIIEIGPEEGRVSFGKKEWGNLVSKAQNGTIWNEVVNIGYGGIEGKVDADVVINLATLLLAQSTSQTSNQQHLESYLSASSSPSFDLTDRLKTSQPANSHTNGISSHRGGTDTPRDLTALVNIIELYTLHVLPRNGEWDFARNFINMSEVLDEEVRERFLQDLQTLEDEEVKGEETFEDALPEQDDLLGQEPLPADEGEKERDSIDTVRYQPPASHHRSDSETDYGIDNGQPPPDLPETKSSPPPPQPNVRPVKVSQSKPPRLPPIKAPRRSATTGIYKRSLAIMSALQNMVSRMTESMSQNPMGLLRFVLFLVGLIVAFSRRDVKDRMGRLTGAGWDKIRKTVGMGVKVSYI